MRVWWGAVAQLGERLVRNEEVSGSIPLSSTKESMSCGMKGMSDGAVVSLFVLTLRCAVRIAFFSPSYCQLVERVSLASNRTCE